MPPRRRKPPRPGALSDLPPLRIIRTILLLQLSYYTTATILIAFSSLVLGQQFSLNLIFDWRSVRGDVTQGWVIGMIWILTSFITVIPILLLLTRSKLVPDFALTVHLFHLLTTSFYTSSIPTNLLWWVLQGASAGLMVSLGVWATRYRELKPISFGLGTSQKAAGAKGVNGSAAGGMGRTGDEHVRGGSGRGGRIQGGSSYEMVPIEEEERTGDENV